MSNLRKVRGKMLSVSLLDVIVVDKKKAKLRKEELEQYQSEH